MRAYSTMLADWANYSYFGGFTFICFDFVRKALKCKLPDLPNKIMVEVTNDRPHDRGWTKLNINNGIFLSAKNHDDLNNVITPTQKRTLIDEGIIPRHAREASFWIKITRA